MRIDKVDGITKAAARPMSGAGGDDLACAIGDDPGNRRRQEQQEATLQRTLAAEPITERAGSEQHPREHQGVGIDDPLQGAARRIELARYRWQRHVQAAVGDHDDREAEAEDTEGPPPPLGCARLGLDHQSASSSSALRAVRRAPAHQLRSSSMMVAARCRADRVLGPIVAAEAVPGRVEADGVADSRGVELGEHLAEVLDRAQPAGEPAVGDEGDRLAAPLLVGQVDGLLQRGRSAVVVLRRDDHEGVSPVESRPVGDEVLIRAGWDHCRQGLLGQVDEVCVEVGALGEHGHEPVGHGAAAATFPRAAHDDGESERCLG